MRPSLYANVNASSNDRSVSRFIAHRVSGERRQLRRVDEGWVARRLRPEAQRRANMAEVGLRLHVRSATVVQRVT